MPVQPTSRRNRCRRLLGLLLAATATAAAAADDEIAVNFVAASDALHTAGQPPAETLASLGERGYGLVVNLAPPTSRDAVANEGQLVSQGGATYVNIPVDWQNPTEADFDLFSAVLGGAGNRRTLVHCQLNMRASVFTFLYRVVHGGVPVDDALGAVNEVWQPGDQWAAFANRVLAEHDVDFAFEAADD